MHYECICLSASHPSPNVTGRNVQHKALNQPLSKDVKHNEHHNAELEHPPEEQSTPERRHPYGIGMVIYDQLAGGREIFLASAMSQ